MQPDIDILNEVYEPRLMLIVYGTTEDFYSGGHYYIESAEIVKEQGKYIPGAFAIIPEEVYKKLAMIGTENTSVKTKRKVIFPENILSYSEFGESQGLVWYVITPKRRLYFEKSMGIPISDVQMPSIIFKWDGSSLNLWMYEGNQRPTMDTELHNAPFFNMISGGTSVCLGNTKVRDTHDTIVDLMEDVEKVFFSSNFTGAVSGATIEKWERYTKTGILPFEECKKTKFKLKDIIK